MHGDRLTGHGRPVQDPRGCRPADLLAAALDAPVSVMATAGEGGAWGIALLAAYMVYGKGKTLEAYLEDIFTDMPSVTMSPTLRT